MATSFWNRKFQSITDAAPASHCRQRNPGREGRAPGASVGRHGSHVEWPQCEFDAGFDGNLGAASLTAQPRPSAPRRSHRSASHKPFRPDDDSVRRSAADDERRQQSPAAVGQDDSTRAGRLNSRASPLIADSTRKTTRKSAMWSSTLQARTLPGEEPDSGSRASGWVG